MNWRLYCIDPDGYQSRRCNDFKRCCMTAGIINDVRFIIARENALRLVRRKYCVRYCRSKICQSGCVYMIIIYKLTSILFLICCHHLLIPFFVRSFKSMSTYDLRLYGSENTGIINS